MLEDNVAAEELHAGWGMSSGSLCGAKESLQPSSHITE